MSLKGFGVDATRVESWHSSELPGCFCKFGVVFVSALVIRAPLLGVLFGPLVFGNFQACVQKFGPAMDTPSTKPSRLVALS